MHTPTVAPALVGCHEANQRTGVSQKSEERREGGEERCMEKRGEKRGEEKREERGEEPREERREAKRGEERHSPSPPIEPCTYICMLLCPDMDGVVTPDAEEPPMSIPEWSMPAMSPPLWSTPLWRRKTGIWCEREGRAVWQMKDDALCLAVELNRVQFEVKK